MIKVIYQWVRLDCQRDGTLLWRLLRNGVVVGDGVTKVEARSNAASFIRSCKGQSSK